MTEIRPLRTADLPAVSALYRTLMEHRALPAPRALENYLRELFLEGPFARPDIPSIVMEADGEIAGFMGVIAQTFVHSGQRLNAAISASLMVKDHEKDPLGGVRLMRAFFGGAQDVTLTETAVPSTLAIWRQLGGRAMDGHSLDWVRVLRPAQFGVAGVARRFKPASLLRPAARFLDRRLVKRGEPGQHLQWRGMSEDFRPGRPLQIKPVAGAELAAMIEEFAAAFAIRPDWSAEAMKLVVRDLALKPQFGPMHAAAVRAPSGAPVGGFIYYLDGTGLARVVQVFARQAQEGLVLDALFSDAVGRGAIAVEGRCSPRLTSALAARRCFLFQRTVSAVHSRTPELANAFVSGEAMFNGVVGEYWSQLYGGSFDAPENPSNSPNGGRSIEKSEFVEAA